MNIVKGVADLIRRSSGGQAGEAVSAVNVDKFSPPSPRIIFGDTGEEAVLAALWHRYENAIDKEEKRKSLQVFLLQFLESYKSWEPIQNDQSTEEQSYRSEEIIVGCTIGHPSDVILILIQEIPWITSLVTQWNISAGQANIESSESPSNSDFSMENFYVLDCLTIITRSMHNCILFHYYKGVPKITALLKAAVVKLKTFTSVLSLDESLSSSSIEKTSTLQKMLTHVVLIIFSFIELLGAKNTLVVDTFIQQYPWNNQLNISSSSKNSSVSEKRFFWHRKAVIWVMEAGGVNWLVELLRTIRRLNLKEQWTDLSIHYLTLGTLKSTLSENPRAQNHFRSIGGLEVLLDGLGLPSSSFSLSKTTCLSEDERNGILRLQILSLEVLRESTFGNINNMQFLFENGRIHKFANSICWPVFMLQELNRQTEGSPVSHSQLLKSNSVNASEEIASPGSSNQYYVDAAILSEWNSYSIKLSRTLCSFLLDPEDSKYVHDQTSVGRSSLSISLAYWDLSVRWIMRVLHTIFPCIKACVGGNVLSEHIRILASTLQHYILCAFRMVLVSAPSLLQVFRNEGLWDLIFSEKIFYFGPSLLNTHTVECKEGFSVNSDMPSAIQLNKDLSNSTGIDIIQEEAISFLEYVATSSGNTNNLPECSVFLDTLEESACDPKVASIILKSLHRILQIAVKQSISSFNSLNVIARVLKVSSTHAQELRKIQCFCIPVKYDLPEESTKSTSMMTDEQTSWVNCMEAAFDLFREYLVVAENGLYLVLINFSCIESLFDLFWEKLLQKHVLEIILRLLQVSPSSEEDNTAKLQLCSKFLETFTRAKEREKESSFLELSLDLLVSIKELILTDRQYYQNLFRNGECFLHIVSLLNGSLDETLGEQLVLVVLETLTLLLTENDDSKFAFRALVGAGYQTLQSLLLDICKSQPSKGLLDAVFSMLVDGKRDEKEKAVIKNEDVIVLFLSLLEKSEYSLQQYGLDLLLNLLKDSISNRTTCCRSGVLSSLLDWFHKEDRDDMITKIIHLIQIVGGHSISGKDIRKIFALLRSGKFASLKHHSSLLLASLGYMLKEKGPAAFFEFSGSDSGIIIKTPIQWPSYRGFSFSCWLRVEDFHADSMMGLFSFLTDNGKGCLAMIAKDKLIFQSINQKRQSVHLALNIDSKKWHFLCITHSIGRAFSGGSQLKCYVDGVLISSEKCSYAKVSEMMTRCTIGTELKPIHEEPFPFNFRKTPFFGQIGPIYTFCDVLSPEQIKGIFCLGPSYMYSFLGNEILLSSDNLLYSGVLDAKDGFSSKILFGLSAQASYRGTLFNVSSMVETSLDVFQAIMKDGTKLCSRRLLQEIIYCVGGVSVFFPLLTQFEGSIANNEHLDRVLVKPIANDNIVAEVIELVASVLDGNVSNQQQMHLLSGFSILGFLLQTVPRQQLNAETLSALKYMFYVVKNSGMSQILVKDLISWVYLNPCIWVYANYEVQRDLYMFLIQYYEDDRSLLPSLCALPQIIDVICQFYWDKAGRSASGNKLLLSSAAKDIIGERPGQEEVHKVRLLLLSLAEMSLREKVSPPDIKALIAFFETSHDMACIEDVLHMIIRALSQKPLLSSFLVQANLVGGCYIFINLLKRDLEPIRMLGLQFLGSLLIGLPSEKKGTKFFSLSVGRSKSLPESFRKGGNLRTEPVFAAISERLFKFPLSDNLYATLFDLLLGGASPKQVLQKRTLDIPNRRINSPGVSSHFVLPQILTCIFKYLAICTDSLTRGKIIGDLLDLLDSNASNIEALQEHCWVSWLEISVILDAVKNYEVERKAQGDSSKLNELLLIRNMYCIVLSHYLYSVKGGWQQLEETINFLVLKCKQGELSHPGFLRDILEDLIGSMVDIPSEENIFISQPCRDNTLYLIKVVNELLINETGIDFLFPGIAFSSGLSENISLEIQKDISSAVIETLKVEGEQFERIPWNRAPILEHEEEMKDSWWNLYDKTWILVNALNGKGPGKMLPKASSLGGPSFGQRARGLVESLNIPAAEMAAVVSGGIGSTFSGKTNKFVDKAILLRGEKCPRIVFHLVILYLCKAGLESASRCVQQFLFLLPSFVQADDDHNKNRIHFFIWSLLAVRSKFGTLDDGARFHVITHVILEIVNSIKVILATGILGRDDPIEVSNNMKEAGFILNLIQRERVLTAAIDEAKYMNIVNADRSKQLQELRTKLDEYSSGAMRQWKNFEDELQSDINAVIVADDNRKTTFQLSHDEDQQTIADKWIHRFRALIDERGPLSSNPFPNNVITHWKLDKTEDLWRRRPKLKRNYKFDERLCHPPVAKSGNDGSHLASEPCADSGTYHPGQVKRFLLKGVRGITEEENSEACDETTDKILLIDSDFNSYSENPELNIVKDYGDQGNIAQDKKEWTYDSGDNVSSEVHLSVPSVLITPKRKLAGRLAVLQDVLHFSGEFLVEGTAGSSVFKSFQELGNLDSSKIEQKQQKFLSSTSETDRGKGSAIDSSDQNALLRGQPTKVKRHRRWKLSKIKAVHWTRYLLQYTAIEIFFNDSTAPVFLNFESQKDAKSVGTLVVSLRNEILQPKGSSRDRSLMISFVDRRAALEMAENVRESWRRREISNFEYIMILNTLSGRSYNDLTQYPVFPWVLADYSSEKLDFNKSSTFRDLTKPVGALDKKRFEVFEDRYRNFSDPDIPSFYYGSHYSSMGIVLYYLIRLEPFTTLHRHLQGGKFDHADRLFHSIDSTYRNCLSNTSDVKELIPEFFYLPDFLDNSNSYHLGVKQDGKPLGDVVLPPWAKGSPEEFIYRNREALESEYVSSNLHHWIDLVFGYKQRGKPSMEAANIFYYLTYEGAVDLDTMDDILQKSAIEDQIANFGQTPIQIFRKKHPRRGPPIPIAHPLTFAPGSITLTSVISNTISPPSAVLFVGLLDSNIILVNKGLTLSIKMWLTTQLQAGGNFTFSGTQEPFFGIGFDVLPPRKIGTHLAENIDFGRQCMATMQVLSESYLISCGNWENSFQVISLSDGRIIQSIRQHKDVVSCVAVSSDGSILATGSHDTTVMVWHTCRGRLSERRSRYVQPEFARRDHVVMESPFHILCGHDDVITCLYVSTELDIVISGSKDGTCIFHTLRQGRYVHSIQHPSGIALSKLVVSQHGRMVIYGNNDLSLHMYSINGKHLASCECNGRLNCIELSTCGDFLVCAGDQGQISLRSMHSLDVIRRYDGVGKIITSLAVTPEECFLAGTKDGSLLVYSIENPLFRRASLTRNSKSKSAAVG